MPRLLRGVASRAPTTARAMSMWVRHLDRVCPVRVQRRATQLPRDGNAAPRQAQRRVRWRLVSWVLV